MDLDEAQYDYASEKYEPYYLTGADIDWLRMTALRRSLPVLS